MRVPLYNGICATMIYGSGKGFLTGILRMCRPKEFGPKIINNVHHTRIVIIILCNCKSTTMVRVYHGTWRPSLTDVRTRKCRRTVHVFRLFIVRKGGGSSPFRLFGVFPLYTHTSHGKPPVQTTSTAVGPCVTRNNRPPR